MSINDQRKARIVRRLEMACDTYRENGKETNESACFFITGWGRLLGSILLNERKRAKNGS